jgi:U2 small nuclear ribonucleoprotein A'
MCAQDQYDTIDFTDNEIRILDNFPKMKRLSTILMSNNYLFRIGSALGTSLTNITTLVLSNNRLASLSEIDHLATCLKLELLSLVDNPVTEKEHYRLYTIHKIPSLKMLDFQKVIILSGNSYSCVMHQ